VTTVAFDLSEMAVLLKICGSIPAAYAGGPGAGPHHPISGHRRSFGLRRETSTRYNRTRNKPYGHAERKKTQEFAYSSALRPNQICFHTAKTHQDIGWALRHTF
jgi:hypothetical protein